MRKAILIAIMLVAIACLSFFLWRPYGGLSLRAYFQNAQGLRVGGQVRVDGLELGKVKEVRIGADGNEPIEVRMTLHTPYPLSIPSDSVASLETDGVLGPTFVEIDTRKGSGPAIGQDGTLRSLESEVNHEGAAHLLEVLGNAMLEQANRLREKDKLRTPETDKQK